MLSKSDKLKLKRRQHKEEKKIRVISSKCSLDVFGTITFVTPEYSLVKVNKLVNKLLKNIRNDISDLKSVFIVALTKHHGLHVHYMTSQCIKKRIKSYLNEPIFANLGSISERQVSQRKHVVVRYMEQNLLTVGSVKYRGKTITCSAVELTAKFPKSKYNKVVNIFGIEKELVTKWVNEPETFRSFEDYSLDRIRSIAEGTDDFIKGDLENLTFTKLLDTTYIPYMKNGDKPVYRFRCSGCDKRTRAILIRNPKFEMQFHEILDAFIQSRGSNVLKSKAKP